MSRNIPSIQFCLTGWLDSRENEKYHQDIHNYGKTIKVRAPQLLSWYSVNEIERWVNKNKHFITSIELEELHTILYPTIPTN
jgi:hypothetical protein